MSPAVTAEGQQPETRLHCHASTQQNTLHKLSTASCNGSMGARNIAHGRALYAWSLQVKDSATICSLPHLWPSRTCVVEDVFAAEHALACLKLPAQNPRGCVAAVGLRQSRAGAADHGRAMMHAWAHIDAPTRAAATCCVAWCSVHQRMLLLRAV